MGESAYAEDDGSGGWNTSSYFDITVTKTTKNCEQVGEVIGDDGYIVQEGYLDCKESDTKGIVRIASIDEGHDYKIVTDDYKINDIEFSKQGDKSLQITRRGATVFNTETWTVEAEDTFSDFWSAVQRQINNNTMTGGVLNPDVTYSFSVGEIKVSSAEEAMTPAGSVDPCWNAGLDSMGWVICPTINNLKYTAGPLESMVESWLTVEPELYNSDSPTHTVWEIMRNIANVVMIVLLLMVIFSQLTGYGIDNYGIKKMLPRLITMAILINLSFVICDIAIDLSNILGVGLRNMFGSIGESITGGEVGNLVEAGVTALFAIAGVAGAVAPTGLEIVMLAGGGAEAGTMVAIVIVLALVVVVAALLLFFVMLGARMVMIILCVAVAPVAFALYIMPNTQNLFKKWWGIFKAALIIFPICGALGGISVLIKAMVWTTDGIHLWMMVVGIIAPFLPFFLLPMLLKNAISALGQVGGALTSMGNRFMGSTRGAVNTVRGSERFKESMQYAQSTAAAERARRIMRRMDERGGPRNAREAHRQARAAHTVSAYEQGRENMHGEIFGRNNRDVNANEFIEALQGNDAEKASAAFSTLVAQGGIDEALTALSSADWAHMDAGVQNRMLQTMSASNIDAAKSYAKYRQTGGKAGFQAWADGSYAASAAGQAEAAAGVKDLSFASHLKEMGAHALDGYDKDQMGFIKKNAGNLASQLGKDNFGAMLGSAAVNSKDAKAQTVAESVISSSIADGTLNVEDLGLTPEMMGSMRGETAEAIKEGYIQVQKSKAQAMGITLSDAAAEQYALADIRNRTRSAIAAVNSDDQIKNRTHQGVKAIFGIT